MRCLLALLLCTSLMAVDGAASGQIGGTLEFADGTPAVRYKGLAPALHGQRWGLAIGLHGINGNEGQLVGPLGDVLGEAGMLDRTLILCLKSQGAGWETVDHEPIRKAVAWACATYPIDPRRVVGWGYSHGGFRWGAFGHQAQDLFAAYVICGGGVSRPDAAEREAGWYLIHGDADGTVQVDGARRAFALLVEAGYDVCYREILGEGHGCGHSAISRPFRVDAARWSDRRRVAAQPLHPQEQAALDGIVAEMDAGKRSSRNWPAVLATIGGPQADAVMLRLLSDEDERIRAAAAAACAGYAVGEPVLATLVGLLDDAELKVRAATMQTLAVESAWGSVAAAEGLAGVLANPTIDRRERAAAAHALGLGVPLQLPCGNPQPAIFTPLIDALEADDQSLRSAAATALRGAAGGGRPSDGGPDSVLGGFGYHPAAAEERRAEAIARYRGWLEAAPR